MQYIAQSTKVRNVKLTMSCRFPTFIHLLGTLSLNSTKENLNKITHISHLPLQDFKRSMISRQTTRAVLSRFSPISFSLSTYLVRGHQMDGLATIVRAPFGADPPLRRYEMMAPWYVEWSREWAWMVSYGRGLRWNEQESTSDINGPIWDWETPANSFFPPGSAYTSSVEKSDVFVNVLSDCLELWRRSLEVLSYRSPFRNLNTAVSLERWYLLWKTS